MRPQGKILKSLRPQGKVLKSLHPQGKKEATVVTPRLSQILKTLRPQGKKGVMVVSLRPLLVRPPPPTGEFCTSSPGRIGSRI